MRKLYTTAFVALMAVGNALADWTPSFTEEKVLTDYNEYGQDGMKTLRADDGTIVLTWYETGDDLLYTDPQFGYWLHMQIFDPKGNALFGNDGVVVSKQPTFTYTTDYDVKFADNGDVLIAWWDVRNDPENRSKADTYVYRYNLKGQPVWSADGVKFPVKAFKDGGRIYAPQLAVCGKSIFVAGAYSEYYKEKATEDNWEPSPWFPDEEMPDSIDVEYSEYQVQCMDENGNFLWDENLTLTTDLMQMASSTDGIYMLYANEDLGLSARRVDTSGKDLWEQPVVVEEEALTSSVYFPKTTIEADGEGGLLLFYRKLNGWTGYMVMNRLHPDGTTLGEAVSLNGSIDGDGDALKAAVRGDKVMTAWSYQDVSSTHYLWTNLVSNDGSFAWTGGNEHGIALGDNDMWGFTAVKVIPQSNGWVTLYGDLQSWNGANFYAVKMDDNGKTLWTKQIAGDDMKSTGFSVVYDESRAYIFYTCDREIGDDWEEQPGDGGMRVFCIDITDEGNSGSSIDKPTTADQQTETYNMHGVRVAAPSQAGVYIVRHGQQAKKVMVK